MIENPIGWVGADDSERDPEIDPTKAEADRIAAEFVKTFDADRTKMRVLPDVPPAVPDGSPSTWGTGTWDLDAFVRGIVRDTIERTRLSETYWYSVSPMIITSPGRYGDQPNQSPGYVITIYTRSPVLGSVLVEGAVQSGFPTRTEFVTIVTTMVGNLRRQARETLR